jgi:hypothetical protein
MGVPPFYAQFPDNSSEDSYHDNNECPIVQLIALRDQIPGLHDPSKRCQHCAQLDTPKAN